MEIPKVSVEEALAIVKAAEEKRQQEFLAKYRALCEEYGLELSANTIWSIIQLRK